MKFVAYFDLWLPFQLLLQSRECKFKLMTGKVFFSILLTVPPWRTISNFKIHFEGHAQLDNSCYPFSKHVCKSVQGQNYLSRLQFKHNSAFSCWSTTTIGQVNGSQLNPTLKLEIHIVEFSLIMHKTVNWHECLPLIMSATHLFQPHLFPST